MSREFHQRKSYVPPGGPIIKDPSVIAAPSADVDFEKPNIVSKPKVPFRRRCCKYLYNKNDNTICGRTARSWLCIIGYSFMYLMFLSTYTMIFLYASLSIIKVAVDFGQTEKVEFLSYRQNGIGLTATPVSSLGGFPLIWYKNGESHQYKRYVDAINKVLNKSKNGTNLGPCAKPPYGYGDKPCVIIRINKQINWSVKPLDVKTADAKNAPPEVKNWIKSKKNMLWLHCSGYHSYDKEHIRSIKYYPDPPGFDPAVFPMDMTSESPLVAVQISDFTLGLSLAMECKLWYENGESSIEFLLYVTPQTVIHSYPGFNDTTM
ncbi:probable sodium/potassium-transporting ATPase subunit beta-3 [Plodia interpunctella]|uniref:probable sodium/potassium-transporting ATPase subunit beta-3 n=1 Tax=Plodia interpunctella TaxID=58824 RepID=UPI002368A6D1|nr:probable sodium/potassium-transporting ATPase subunit beta-3 [Plodia interpunctella]